MKIATVMRPGHLSAGLFMGSRSHSRLLPCAHDVQRAVTAVTGVNNRIRMMNQSCVPVVVLRLSLPGRNNSTLVSPVSSRSLHPQPTIIPSLKTPDNIVTEILDNSTGLSIRTLLDKLQQVSQDKEAISEHGPAIVSAVGERIIHVLGSASTGNVSLADNSAVDGLSMADVCAAVRVLDHDVFASTTFFRSSYLPMLSQYMNALEALARTIIAANNQHLQLSAKDIENLCIGLRCRKSHYEPCVTSFIHSLLPVLEVPLTASSSTLASLSTTQIVNIVHGMNGLSCEDASIRRLVNAVNTMIADSNNRTILLSVDECGQLLYGFRFMSSDFIEVRQLLATCLQIIRTSIIHIISVQKQTTPDTPTRIAISASTITQMIVGLRGKTSRHKVVCNLLDLLSSLLPQCREDLSPYQVRSIFDAMGRCCLSESESVHKFVDRLLPFLYSVRIPVNSTDANTNNISMAVGEREHDESSVEEVRTNRRNIISAGYIAQILFGIQHLAHQSYTEKRSVLDEGDEEISGNFDRMINASTSTVGSRARTDLIADLLNIVVAQMGSHMDDMQFKSKSLGMALYGLKNMSASIPEVRLFIRKLNEAITNQLKEDSEHRENLLGLDSKCITQMFTGIRYLDADFKVIGELFLVINRLLSANMTTLTALDRNAVGQMLAGMYGMNSRYPEVRTLVKTVATILQANQLVALDERGLDTALYGLKGLSSDCEEVRELLLAVAVLLRHNASGDDSVPKYPIHLTPKSVSKCLYGLYSMDSSDVRVKELLIPLADIIHRSAEHIVMQRQSGDEGSYTQWSPSGVRMAMQGLRGLDSEIPETRKIVKSLVMIMNAVFDERDPNRKCHMTVSNFVNALNGLRSLSTEHEEVKELLRAFATHACHGKFENNLTRRNSKAARFGLQRMDPNCPEVQRIHKILHDNRPDNHKRDYYRSSQSEEDRPEYDDFAPRGTYE
jgi:hypothetical protein